MGLNLHSTLISPVQTLHQQAMDCAENAALAKLRGDLTVSQTYLTQALQSETQAAALLANQWTAEPSRSVLHRSAASLALQCGQLEAAEQLIVTALMGNPPPEIAEELRDLFVQINLNSFLQRRGIPLTEIPASLRSA
jgi:hypothetical protein